jgi:hypothetical protein
MESVVAYLGAVCANLVTNSQSLGDAYAIREWSQPDAEAGSDGEEEDEDWDGYPDSPEGDDPEPEEDEEVDDEGECEEPGVDESWEEPKDNPLDVPDPEHDEPDDETPLVE